MNAVLPKIMAKTLFKPLLENEEADIKQVLEFYSDELDVQKPQNGSIYVKIDTVSVPDDFYTGGKAEVNVIAFVCFSFSKSSTNKEVNLKRRDDIQRIIFKSLAENQKSIHPCLLKKGVSHLGSFAYNGDTFHTEKEHNLVTHSYSFKMYMNNFDCWYNEECKCE